jgi:hypothetical protein
MKTQEPDCRRCAHYFITHQINFRYGCRAMDFKSRRLPMLDVSEASGETCHYFKKRSSASKQTE